MKNTQKWLIAGVSAMLCTMAFAEPTCTKEAKDKWMDEAKFKEQLAQEGYTIDKFKTTKGNCFEIYGKNKEGKKVEIYFNPVDGKAVKTEVHK